MGNKVDGVVLRGFETDKGQAYTLELLKPVKVGEGLESRVSVGGMKGFEMALQAAGLSGLVVGDKVHLESTGTTPAKEAGHSPMVNFAVEVHRDGKVYKGKTEDAAAPFLNAPFWGA